MELRNAIEQRQSIRSFTKEPVALSDIREMVRRAGLAPSVDNSQLWHFIAITNHALLNRMALAVSKGIDSLAEPGEMDIHQSVLSRVEWFSTFFNDAPAVISLAMQHHEGILEKESGLNQDVVNKMRVFPEIQSAGAAIQNILLTAVELGYGACWLSAPLIAGEELSKLMKLDPAWKLIAMVAIGKPFNHPNRKKKKTIDEILQVIT
jgi:nitroreductase